MVRIFKQKIDNYNLYSYFFLILVKRASQSFPKAQALWDEGRDAFKFSMEVKERTSTEHRLCVLAGTCPELVNKFSSGPVPCVGGKLFLNVKEISYFLFVA